MSFGLKKNKDEIVLDFDFKIITENTEFTKITPN